MSKRDSEAANLRQQGLSYAQIAERMGISESAARGTASRGKRAVVIQDDEYTALLEEVQELRNKYTELKATVSGMYEPSARDDNDWATWDAEYKRLLGLNRMIVVHSINDMHIPDEDEQCIELDLAINAALQPDITIFGGDMFDFDVLSIKYKRMYNRRRKDPFLEVEPRWNEIVTEVKRNNPKGVIMATGDNHGQIRMENFINEWVQVFGDRLTADYNALVRSDNRVLWLGWVQEIYMNKTIFEHGKKAGANPALANFKSHGESFSDVAGHAHRWQQLVSIKQQWLQDQRRMLYYPLVSAVTGCSQHVPPHYITDTKAVNSTQGCAVSHVNLHGLDTHVQNILYHPRVDGSLIAVFGDRVFEVAAMANELRRTA